MEQLSSDIQKNIGELLIFSRKPPEYDASKAQQNVSEKESIRIFLEKTKALNPEERKAAISQLNTVMGIFNAIKKELNPVAGDDKNSAKVTELQERKIKEAVENFHRVTVGILDEHKLQSSEIHKVTPYKFHDYLRDYGSKHAHIGTAHEGLFHREPKNDNLIMDDDADAKSQKISK